MNNDRLKEIARMEVKLSIPKKKKASRIVGIALSAFIYYSSAVVGRVIEVLFSMFISLFATFPLFSLLLIRKLLSGANIFLKREIFTLNAKKASIFYFNIKPYFLRNLSLFPYVISNHLSLVGVSMQSYEKKSSVSGDSYLRNNRPGIFNLWYIRSSSRLTHEGKAQIEFEYLLRKNFLTDIILILKSIPAAFYHVSQENLSDTVNLLGLCFQNLTMNEAIDLLKSNILAKKKSQVSFVNPDCFNKIIQDEAYFDALQKSDLVFPDGIGVNIACKILQTPLNENINGTDMLPFICSMVIENDFSIFLLGGKPGISERVEKNLTAKFPKLSIAGEHHGYFDKGKESEEIIAAINKSCADIVLVAFGAPLQEKWILEHKADLNCSVMIGVGGLFDFFSGNIPRAPKWMREIGLEWIFRLIQEPKRMWKRYIIGNPLFIFRVLRWKFQGN